MLTIHPEQMRELNRATLQRFADEMFGHAREFSPDLCKTLSNEELARGIWAAIEQSRGYGFERRGPIRLYIELSLLFGSKFDTDPQYPWAGRILRENRDEMLRAEGLYRAVLRYQDATAGNDASSARRAMQRLHDLAQMSHDYAAQDFSSAMLGHIAHSCPEKFRHAGNDAMLALIREAGGAARRAGFQSARAYALVVALMVAFGHGCICDPFYPWISNTLADPMIATAGIRADRLERKALIWLKSVMSDTAAVIRHE
ncbi:MAG: hypothetical protein KF778_06205 [Rhodocyclaceae bacterium]|nr:hypothetical protein [Rhodocyclaceae bacterium]MBX3667979.1 hypothetical protein [Rhodocyclaceae bacterium]